MIVRFRSPASGDSRSGRREVLLDLLDAGRRDRDARLRGACYAGKADVIIYDHVDDGVPVLTRMHQKRLAGYRAMGYTVANEVGCAESLIL